MATVTAFIRTSKKSAEKANLRFRLRDGRSTQLFHVSEISINTKLWSNKDQGINPRIICETSLRMSVAQQVANRKQLILSIYDNAPSKEGLSTAWLEEQIEKLINPTKYLINTSLDFFDIFLEFIEVHKVSHGRKRCYFVVKRELERFELVKRSISSSFKLLLDNFDTMLLREFELFLADETSFSNQLTVICEQDQNIIPPKKRGQNTISSQLAVLRTFFNWAIKNKKTQTTPFSNFKIAEQIYGSPYYISIDERNKLYNINLSNHRHLSIQRDIFVFQCLTGCRVGDLIKLTKRSVINDAIEYIPHKTKEGRPITVRVPLNKIAREIVLRYSDIAGDKLLPFISAQKYNDAIKVMFRAARLTRTITVLNSATRLEEKQRLCDIASSHLARRCFVGNLYKQVKYPNLVGALSGHKEGSKAFARYREIDDAMKIELVNLLD